MLRVSGEWQQATSRDCSALEDVQQFLEEAVRGSCEGLMVKALAGPHAHYDIARRSHNWLKVANADTAALTGHACTLLLES